MSVKQNDTLANAQDFEIPETQCDQCEGAYTTAQMSVKQNDTLANAQDLEIPETQACDQCEESLAYTTAREITWEKLRVWDADRLFLLKLFAYALNFCLVFRAVDLVHVHYEGLAMHHIVFDIFSALFGVVGSILLAIGAGYRVVFTSVLAIWALHLGYSSLRIVLMGMHGIPYSTTEFISHMVIVVALVLPVEYARGLAGHNQFFEYEQADIVEKDADPADMIV